MGWAGFIYFGYIIISSAQTVDINQQVKQVERTMKLLDYKKINTASKQVYQFFDQFPDQALETSDEKMMFHHIEIDVKQALSSQVNGLEEVKEELYKLYLFVDTLQAENKPLWKVQATRIEQALAQLLQEEKPFTAEVYQELKLVYERLYPSLYISTSPLLLQEINKKMEFLDFYAWNRHTNSSYTEELADLQADFAYLLEENKKDEIDLSFYLLFFFTGGTILSTLSYVAVRRYLAERRENKHPVRSKDL